MTKELETFYNLPNKVKFCSICVNSNQYPASIPEFKHSVDRKNAQYVNFSEEDICDGCQQAKIKNSIDWKRREDQLLRLLDNYRKNNGEYDCLVPGSGGKDSVYASHLLKYKYGMNPLTVTWPPIMYTDYGYQNYKNWIDKGGFDNITYRPSGEVMRKLTKIAIETLLHPFQTFILGQKNLAPKIASKYGIDLVFYGENEAEYGNPLADNEQSLRDKSFYSINNLEKIRLAGKSLVELKDNYGLNLSDLKIFLPLLKDEYKENLQIHYLGYYIKWVPQEAYYYAVENTNFKARPFRTQGTYSKYNSIDDKIDDLHYYTRFIKFGIGRATDDASQEIRNNHLTRDEGMALVKRFDGELPDKYLNEVLEYLEIDEDYFHKRCDEFRSPHLWKHDNNKWHLRHTVNKNGYDD